MRQTIGAIGRDLNIEDHVVETIVFGESSSDWRIRWQNQNAIGFLFKPELAFRSQHTQRLSTSRILIS